MLKIILITDQKDPAMNQMCFESALELLDKELEQGRACNILLSEKKRTKLGVRVLEECEILVQGYFDFMPCNLGGAIKSFNKEVLDNLKIEYNDKIQ